MKTTKAFIVKELGIEVRPAQEWTKPYDEIEVPKSWRKIKVWEVVYLFEEGYKEQLLGKFLGEYNYVHCEQTEYAKKNNFSAGCYLGRGSDLSAWCGGLGVSNDGGSVVFVRNLEVKK